MTTKAQRKLRLNDLADLIEQMPDRQFNYDHWCARLGAGVSVQAIGNTLNDILHVAPLREGDCNTAGCVAGWGCWMGLQQGYSPRHCHPDMLIHQYAQKYLGLTVHEANEIFMGGAMFTCGIYDDDELDTDEVRKVVSNVEVAKMLRMVANDEVEL